MGKYKINIPKKRIPMFLTNNSEEKFELLYQGFNIRYYTPEDSTTSGFYCFQDFADLVVCEDLETVYKIVFTIIKDCNPYIIVITEDEMPAFRYYYEETALVAPLRKFITRFYDEV